MYQNAILGLQAQTSIHVGASDNRGAIDLPIQREAHSHWPVIFGAGLKGGLRNHVYQQPGSQATLTVLFGPSVKEASANPHAGALMVNDARLLLLPVRSLTGYCKWVTCPSILQRFKRDLQRINPARYDQDFDIPNAQDAKGDDTLPIAIVPGMPDKPQDLYLEEYRFKVESGNDLSKVIKPLKQLIADDYQQQQLEANLAIISDVQFSYLCQFAIPAHAHIAINPERKAVEDGALWYEESLPPDTLMYSCLACSNGRNGAEDAMTAERLLEQCKTALPDQSFIQIGGNATTGMGWFQAKWQDSKTGAQ